MFLDFIHLFYVFNVWMVLQKHIRWIKCLNLYQMSALFFFMSMGTACSMSSSSVAHTFDGWILMAGDDGCIWITQFVAFVALPTHSIGFDAIVIELLSRSSVVIVVWNRFGISESAAIPMLIPLCLANNFSSSIASSASRFSCKNL